MKRACRIWAFVQCLLLSLFLVVPPLSAGWEDSYLPQIRAGIADPSHKTPAPLLLPRRARQMSANHNAMRIEELYRSGAPEGVQQVREWLRRQTTIEHMGPEQGSTVYWAFYVQIVAGVSIHAHRIGDSEILDLCRLWWLHDAALRWAMRTPKLDVIGPGSRANRPYEWGLGAVLRAQLGRLTANDWRVIRKGRYSPNPELWAIQEGIEAGAVPTFTPQQLEHVRPPLRYPLTIWRAGVGMGAWSPLLESAGGSIPQWAVLVLWDRPMTLGDPNGSNPLYMRGVHRKTRAPQEAPAVPSWYQLALELEETGAVTRIDLGTDTKEGSKQ